MNLFSNYSIFAEPNYSIDLNNVDEFTAYANSDGTFMIEMQMWGNVDGNLKRVTVNFPSVRFGDIEVVMNEDTPKATFLVKE